MSPLVPPTPLKREKVKRRHDAYRQTIAKYLLNIFFTVAVHVSRDA